MRDRCGFRVFHPPTGGLLDESAGFALPAHLHLVATNQDRRGGRKGRRLPPPVGVVVDDTLLEVHTGLGEVTPRPLAGGSVPQRVEDGGGHLTPSGVGQRLHYRPRLPQLPNLSFG